MSAARFAFVAMAVLVGCGGASEVPPPAVPQTETSAPAPARVKREAPQVSQELGEIDPKEVEATFAKWNASVHACHAQGIKRLDYLAGDLRVFVRVGQDGRAKFAYFEEASIGDRDTEKCILQVLQRASWPKPKGGEAEVRKAFSFAPGDAREPTNWAPAKVEPSLTKAEEAIKKCRGTAGGAFSVTAYVEPDGKGGKVVAAGVASPHASGEEQADCIVNAVKSMPMPSPGSYAAKVSFRL